MRPHVCAGVAAAVVVAVAGLAHADTAAMARFMYKFSFKPPALTDGGLVPFWEYSGSTIVSPDRVRLTPSIRSKSGRIFSKSPNPMQEWQIVLKLSIAGRAKVRPRGSMRAKRRPRRWLVSRLPAGARPDGRRRHDLLVHEAAHGGWPRVRLARQRDGLGVFFDTYDNDGGYDRRGWGRRRRREARLMHGLAAQQPVMGMLNDGTRSYDHESDAANQVFESCTSHFRNAIRPPIFRITYLQRRLTVEADVTGDGDKFSECFKQEDIDLPTGYYFGMSAATGGLADDHDVLSFEAFWLNPEPRHEGSAGRAAEGGADAAAAEHEYEQRMAEYEKKREEYLQSHPEEREDQAGEDESVSLHVRRRMRERVRIAAHLRWTARRVAWRASATGRPAQPGAGGHPERHPGAVQQRRGGQDCGRLRRRGRYDAAHAAAVAGGRAEPARGDQAGHQRAQVSMLRMTWGAHVSPNSELCVCERAAGPRWNVAAACGKIAPPPGSGSVAAPAEGIAGCAHG